MSYGLSKRGALLVMAAVALLFALPGLRHARGLDQADSFPASRFTMFAHKREDVQPIVYLRGFDKRGESRSIPVVSVWPGGMNAGWKRLSKIARSKQAVRRDACKSAAKAIRKRKGTRDIVRLEIVDARYSITEFFQRGVKKPQRERIVVSCDVRRRGSKDER